MRLVNHALIVVLLALPMACKTLVLKADFEDDTVGTPPTRDLPGAPEGDMIKWNNVTDATALIVSDDAIEGQSLKIAATLDAEEWTYAELVKNAPVFLLSSVLEERSPYYVATWQGHVRSDPDSPDLKLRFLFGNLTSGAAVLRVNDDKFEVADGSSWVVVGDAAPGIHTIVITIDDRHGTYHASITQTGRPVIEVGPRSLSFRSSTAYPEWFEPPTWIAIPGVPLTREEFLRRLQLNFWYGDPGANAYVVDSIRIWVK